MGWMGQCLSPTVRSPGVGAARNSRVPVAQNAWWRRGGGGARTHTLLTRYHANCQRLDLLLLLLLPLCSLLPLFPISRRLLPRAACYCRRHRRLSSSYSRVARAAGCYCRPPTPPPQPQAPHHEGARPHGRPRPARRRLCGRPAAQQSAVGAVGAVTTTTTTTTTLAACDTRSTSGSQHKYPAYVCDTRGFVRVGTRHEMHVVPYACAVLFRGEVPSRDRRGRRKTRQPLPRLPSPADGRTTSAHLMPPSPPALATHFTAQSLTLSYTGTPPPPPPQPLLSPSLPPPPLTFPPPTSSHPPHSPPTFSPPPSSHPPLPSLSLLTPPPYTLPPPLSPPAPRAAAAVAPWPPPAAPDPARRRHWREPAACREPAPVPRYCRYCRYCRHHHHCCCCRHRRCYCRRRRHRCCSPTRRGRRRSAAGCLCRDPTPSRRRRHIHHCQFRNHRRHHHPPPPPPPPPSRPAAP